MENERSRGWLDLPAASAPRLQLLDRSISRETGQFIPNRSTRANEASSDHAQSPHTSTAHNKQKRHCRHTVAKIHVEG